MASVQVDKEATRNADEGAVINRVAYLGPSGTYGNQAANAFLPYIASRTELIACPNISSIYTTPAEYLVMPLQNTIYGPVIETLDCLLGTNAEAGPSSLTRPSELDAPVIIGSLDLPIRHCLATKTGVTMEEIQWVRSHEQALGQSAKFLAEKLPNVKIEQWPSTAGAALSLLDPDTYPVEGGVGAAICSKAVVELYPDRLKVLYEGTQSIADNYTRFLLLSRMRPLSVPPTIAPKVSSFFVMDHLEDIALLDKKSALKAIHSRPAPPSERCESKLVDGHQHPDMYPLRYLVETSHTQSLGSARHLGQTTICVRIQ